MSTAKSINAYAILEPGGQFEPHTYSVEDLKNNEVEMDVLHSGICHSDLSMVDNEWGLTKYPLVAGHEGCRCIRLRAGHSCGSRLA
jgi:uncharacterized zinc-type alcohol dehydrogenase-like protein